MSDGGNSRSATTGNVEGRNGSSHHRDGERSRSPGGLSRSSKVTLRDSSRDRDPLNKFKQSYLATIDRHLLNNSSHSLQKPTSKSTRSVQPIPRPPPDYSGSSFSNADVTRPSSVTSARYDYGSSSGTTGGVNSVASISRVYSFNSNNPQFFDRSRNQRFLTERAIRDRKVFSILGSFPAIRRALIRRGWVEKGPHANATAGQPSDFGSTVKASASSYDQESDSAWAARVLRGYAPDFIWTYKRDSVQWNSMFDGQLINRHPNAFFTSKVGIAACLHNFHWYSEPAVSQLFFPRCYRLAIDEEKAAFVGDFRLCACMGLLKWVVGAYEREGDDGVLEPPGNVGVVPACLRFARRQLSNYVRLRRHEDIDWTATPGVAAAHWDVFLVQYYNIVLLKMKLTRTEDTETTAKGIYDTSKRALRRLAPFWPQLSIDGTSNIWICKPGARSRGIGIILMNQLDKILGLLGQNHIRESNWVVQKYIERPLLIYNTKFDIRQWFIVSDWSPLTVWFYKESYIRFCSKPFTMDDFHESIHLCNNAVQVRYKNSPFRDSALPDENMWDNYTFQAYLKSLGKMDLWDSLIYPGMKQGVLGVLLASQENITAKKGCFELYGADFMLSEDFHPWLIEINSSPCMAGTTRVTQRLCSQCLEDLIKVMVDRRKNHNASTGLFELVYKQAEARVPHSYHAGELVIQGRKLIKDHDWPSLKTMCTSKTAKSKKKSTLGSNSGASMSLETLPSSENQPVGELRVTSGMSILSMSVAHGRTFMNLIQSLRLKDAQQKSPADSNMDTSTSPTPNRTASKLPATSRSASRSRLAKAKSSQSRSKFIQRQIALQSLAAAHHQLQLSSNRHNNQEALGGSSTHADEPTTSARARDNPGPQLTDNLPSPQRSVQDSAAAPVLVPVTVVKAAQRKRSQSPIGNRIPTPTPTPVPVSMSMTQTDADMSEHTGTATTDENRTGTMSTK